MAGLNAPAIKVEGVYKDFVLPHERVSSVKGLFTSLAKGRLSKTKESQHALRDISFEVKEGEFFGIVGRNGSGKSTLLKILAGIYQPTKGKVSTRGKLVPFIELGVGFNPELTGRENVFLNGAMLGFSESEMHGMYDEIVRFAELERFMDQKLKNYSSGMQVRLAFSMATRAEADILLVDEVLAVGDADFQRKCFDYFKKLKKDNKTVVFVSHDMDAVREYCDRALLIEQSKLVEIGRPDAIAQLYAQLFMAPTQQAAQADDKAGGDENQEDGRWGNGKAKTRQVNVKVSDKEIAITQTLQASAALKQPVIGLRIRDATGKDITGTNSKIERQPCPDLAAGQRCTITWCVPNIFSDGSYLVDLAVHEADGVTVCDWQDEAANFSVRKLRHVPYTIAPDIALTYDT